MITITLLAILYVISVKYNNGDCTFAVLITLAFTCNFLSKIHRVKRD